MWVKTYLMYPVWALFVLAATLIIYCGHILIRSDSPESGEIAYDLKTVFNVQLASGIILLASIYNIWLGPEYARRFDNFGTFWLYCDGIVVLLLLTTKGRRRFGALMALILTAFCVNHYWISEIFDIRKLHRPERILYMQIGFVLNILQCGLFIWGMYHVRRIGNTLPRTSGIYYSKLASFSYLARIRGRRIFIIERIRKAKNTRMENEKMEG